MTARSWQMVPQTCQAAQSTPAQEHSRWQASRMPVPRWITG